MIEGIILAFTRQWIFITPRGTIVELSTGLVLKMCDVQGTGQSVSSLSFLPLSK